MMLRKRRPIHAPHQRAAVDEQRGSRAYANVLAQRLGFVHFRLGFLVIHAAGQLQRIEFLALGKLQHLVLQILGR